MDVKTSSLLLIRNIRKLAHSSSKTQESWAYCVAITRFSFSPIWPLWKRNNTIPSHFFKSSLTIYSTMWPLVAFMTLVALYIIVMSNMDFFPTFFLASHSCSRSFTHTDTNGHASWSTIHVSVRILDLVIGRGVSVFGATSSNWYLCFMCLG